MSDARPFTSQVAHELGVSSPEAVAEAVRAAAREGRVLNAQTAWEDAWAHDRLALFGGAIEMEVWAQGVAAHLDRRTVWTLLESPLGEQSGRLRHVLALAPALHGLADREILLDDAAPQVRAAVLRQPGVPPLPERLLRTRLGQETAPQVLGALAAVLPATAAERAEWLSLLERAAPRYTLRPSGEVLDRSPADHHVPAGFTAGFRRLLLFHRGLLERADWSIEDRERLARAGGPATVRLLALVAARTGQRWGALAARLEAELWPGLPVGRPAGLPSGVAPGPGSDAGAEEEPPAWVPVEGQAPHLYRVHLDLVRAMADDPAVPRPAVAAALERLVCGAGGVVASAGPRSRLAPALRELVATEARPLGDPEHELLRPVLGDGAVVAHLDRALRPLLLAHLPRDLRLALLAALGGSAARRPGPAWPSPGAPPSGGRRP